MKVSVIGAGHVGGEVANRLASLKLADDVVILDIDKELALAKAQDISHAVNIFDLNCKVTGTNEYKKIDNSDIIVITAGSARKPGMTRDDLAKNNQQVMKSVSSKIKKFAPGCIILVVTNPVDLMTFFVRLYTGFDRKKVIGMAGILDSGRLKYVVSQQEKIGKDKKREALVIGPHRSSMICLPEHTTIEGKKIIDYFSEDKVKEIFKEVSNTGSKLVSLYKGNSAFFGPSAGISKMIKMIKENSKGVIPCSVLLKGEYGVEGVCLGVPVQLCSRGIKDMKEVKLNKQEKEKFVTIAKKYRKKIDSIREV